MGRARKVALTLAALALCTPLMPRSAAAAGGFTIVMGGANPLHALGGSYNAGTYVTADVDSDGDLDVVVREPLLDTTIDVLRNDGGSFTLLTGPASPFAGISFPAHSLNFLNSRVLTGDFDADGDVDLWHHAVTFAAFYRNDGGTFSAHVGSGDPLNALATRDAGSYVTIDVDDDGDPDVVAREPGSDASLELFRNDAGTFVLDPAPFASIAFPSSPANFLNTNVLVLDADRDGDDDLWHHGVGFAALYRNDGDSFTELTGADDPLAELGGYDPGTYMTGDIDSDGDTDVIAREPITDLTIDVLRNDVSGFTRLTGAASPFAASPLGSSDFAKSRTLVGDHDGDGDADVYNHVLNELYVQAGSAPRLVAQTPAHRATAVAVTSALTVTFDEPVTLGAGSIVLRRAGTGALLERLRTSLDADRFDGLGTTTLTITPRTPLPFGSTVTVEIEPGAILSSADGDAFAGSDPIAWRFETATNTPPGLTNLDGDTVVYTEGDAPVALDAGLPLVVTDADGLGFEGGELVATLHGGVPGEDQLVATAAAGLGTVTDDGTSVHIALGAGATQGSLTTFLQSITYANHGGDNPTPGARTVTFTISDGAGASVDATVGLTVVAVNDPPVLTVPAGYSVASGATLTIGDVTIGDVDDDLLALTATVDVGAFDGDQPTLTAVGSTADLHTALAAGALRWHAPLVSSHGTLQLTVDDGEAQVTAFVELNAIKVAQPGPAPSQPSPPFPTPGAALLTPAPWEDPVSSAATRSYQRSIDRRDAPVAPAEREAPSGAAMDGGIARQGGAPAATRTPESNSSVHAAVWVVLPLGLLTIGLLIVVGRREREDRPTQRES